MDKEILEKAITKANNNGFKGTVEQMQSYIEAGMTDPLVILGTLIVDKDFAKALWGEGGGGISQGGTGKLGWWNHLQNMVVSDDPIKYLGDNL